MIKKLMCKLNPTIENLEKELLSKNFNKDNASNIIASKKVDVNDLTSSNETLLNQCLKNNKFKAAFWLIGNNANSSILNQEGKSPIRVVIEKGENSLLKEIIKTNKAELYKLDKDNRSLLQDAILSGNNLIIETLLRTDINKNNVDKNNRNIIFDAISYGDDKIIDLILEIEDLDLNLRDKDGKTILHNQKVLENDKLAKKLLEKGADPTICDNKGDNFLSKTVLRGKSGEIILDVAIKCGCDLNKKIANEKSILMEVMYAFSKLSRTEEERRRDLKTVASKLIRHGINIDAINNKGETVLFDLIREGDVEGCAFVLENGVNINQINNKKESALYVSIFEGIKNLDIIILLLQYGADPLFKNKNNETIPEVLNKIILHVHNNKDINDDDIKEKINASGNYMLILKEILELEGMEFNYLDTNGDPLFFLPFLNGNIKTTQLYLKNGLDINQKNKEGLNIFFKYILQVFQKGKYIDDFRDKIVFLLINKVDKNYIDQEGKNIYTRIASIKNCNIQLFKKLVDITKHDYKAQDNMGRTIMHHCVFSDNFELLKVIYTIEKDILNIYDAFSILPLTYAALKGNSQIVKYFLDKDSIINSGKEIHVIAKKKFKPMLKNMEKMIEECQGAEYRSKLELVYSQMKRDFS